MKPPIPLASFLCLLAVASLATTNEVRTHNTPRTFPAITSHGEWLARARDIREQALVSCGLWPMPEKPPLKARAFDRIEREDYTVEKVYFQSWPGFYVGGNLYRPRGKGEGPFPAVLNPHGHWGNGRLTDGPDASIPGRCINLARQGMIAFAYDMVGYNDTTFPNHPREGEPGGEFGTRHRFFATNAICQLWGISLMGLQTWNSIRALDFLETLPDVDRSRLACTGASGGGTQTFMLGAMDDRLTVQAPVCMVSHTMQGGCACENAPGLRLDFSNMEYAAAAAPRPQLLVAATGDWTKDTPTVEGPALEAIYQLFETPDSFRHVRFNSGHNYNQTSREAVYAWLGRWLLQQSDAPSLAESRYEKPPDAELRVFPEGNLPADAVTDEQLIAWLVAERRAHLAALQPRTKKAFAEFREVMLPLWRRTLQVRWPSSTTHVRFTPVRSVENAVATDLQIRRDNETEAVLATRFMPRKPHASSRTPFKLIVLVHTNAAEAYLDPQGNPRGLARLVLDAGHGVLVITQFTTTPAGDPFTNHYTTYNRTRLQHRVRDVLSAIASARMPGTLTENSPRVVLWGEGRAGLWALLAAPAADAVVADCAGIDFHNDESLLAPDLFCPGLQRLGGFETAVLLAAPNRLLLHNSRATTVEAKLRPAFKALGSARSLQVDALPIAGEQIVRWISRR